MPHTKGNWKVGKNTGCVVSDDLLQATDKDVKTGHAPEDDYYGGLLICESIRTISDAKLIAAAPVMKHALEFYVHSCDNGGSKNQTFYDMAVWAINKATNETP